MTAATDARRRERVTEAQGLVFRTLAIMEGQDVSETLFGGRSRVWREIAVLWVDVRPTGHRQADEGPNPALIETATAVARKQIARAGMRLKTGSSPWTITNVQSDAPTTGKMTLILERPWS